MHWLDAVDLLSNEPLDRNSSTTLLIQVFIHWDSRKLGLGNVMLLLSDVNFSFIM